MQISGGQISVASSRARQGGAELSVALRSRVLEKEKSLTDC